MATVSDNKKFAQEFKMPDLDEVATWIDDNLYPEDVFGESKLIQWAEQNGYIQKED